MANWLHKTTREYRVSSDPSDPANWIRNPELPSECEDWSWVVVDGETVRAPTTEERAAITAVKLAEAKAAKIALIDAKTAQLIEDGKVVINGESISTRQTQQTSLLGIKAAIDVGLGTFPRDLSAADGQTYSCPNLEDFVRISGLVLAFVESTKASGRTLRAQVLACTALAEVAAVEDSR